MSRSSKGLPVSATQMISKLLVRDGVVDNHTVIHRCLSLRLAARIKNLRDAGWVIKTERDLKTKNTFYKLVSAPRRKRK